MGAFSWFRDKNTKKNKQETPTVESHYIKLARRASFMRYAVLLFIVLFGVYSFSFHSSEITVDNFDYMMKFLNVNEDEQANKGNLLSFDGSVGNRGLIYKGDLAVLNENGLTVTGWDAEVILRDSFSFDHPKLIENGKRLFAYGFEGYWKDVGTIESLWEANMDLLGKTPEFNLFDKHWRIFYRHNAEPPHKFGANGKAYNTMLTEGCVVNGEVRNSVLSNGVCIEEGAYVNDCVIMANVTIKKGAKVEYAIIDYDTVIGENATVGGCRAEGNKITVLGAGCKVADGDTVPAGAMLDAQI